MTAIAKEKLAQTEWHNFIAGQCITDDSSADANKPCLFPFKFYNEWYYGCKLAGSSAFNWCATELTNDGEYISGKWGYCDMSIPECAEIYKNLGEDCWWGCSQTQGACAWCGTEGLCCRKGHVGNGCDGQVGDDDFHMCVKNEGRVDKVKLSWQNLS